MARWAERLSGRLQHGVASLVAPLQLEDEDFRFQPSGQTIRRAPGSSSIADFKFGKEIGDGSFSTVYLATRKDTGREFAIKVLSKALLVKNNKVDNVMEEKRILLALKPNPMVVALYETMQDADSLYFVMDACPAGDLHSHLWKVGAFAPEVTRHFTAEIIIALEFLRTKRVIHRDLKPENILLTNDNHIKLCDFGSAELLVDGYDHGSSEFGGTAQYVSPEVLDSKYSCFSSDLWALGCLVYRMISSSLPFNEATDFMTFEKVISGKFDYLPGFTDCEKDFISSILKVNPDDRLGAGSLDKLKAHSFFESTAWEDVGSSTVKIFPYVPAVSSDEQVILGLQAADPTLMSKYEEDKGNAKEWEIDESSKAQRLKQQEENSAWHFFTDTGAGEIILQSCDAEQCRGLRRYNREVLVTDKRRIMVMDTTNLNVDISIDLSAPLVFVELVADRIFIVYTPSMLYYFRTEGPASPIVHCIDTVMASIEG